MSGDGSIHVEEGGRGRRGRSNGFKPRKDIAFLEI
jgi:hypothetical protein